MHEAYLKLAEHEGLIARDRAHFYAIASRAMRQLIIDFARKKATKKRGAGFREVPLEKVDVAVEEEAELLLAIDELLHELSRRNQRLTRVFECRYFGGMTAEETADALDVSLRTVERDWTKSKAWLREALAAAARPMQPGRGA